jgi:hypothetical protein
MFRRHLDEAFDTETELETEGTAMRLRLYAGSWRLIPNLESGFPTYERR